METEKIEIIDFNNTENINNTNDEGIKNEIIDFNNFDFNNKFNEIIDGGNLNG